MGTSDLVLSHRSFRQAETACSKAWVVNISGSAEGSHRLAGRSTSSSVTTDGSGFFVVERLGK